MPLLMKYFTSFIAIALGSAALSGAQDVCDKSFTKWNEQETYQILNDSPWSKRMAIGRPVMSTETQGDWGQDSGGRTPRGLIDGGRDYGGDKGSGISGEKERYDAYQVRLFTAPPLRQAYVRMFQLMNKYDDMQPADQRTFDSRFARALNLDTRDDIIVSVEFFTNNPQLGMEVDRQLKQANFELLKQSAYLIADGAGRIPLKGYFPPSQDGTGAKLVFPRVIKGKQVLTTEDQELKLEFFVPAAEHKVYVVWKVRELMCGDKLMF
jgi:hypothetical protein